MICAYCRGENGPVCHQDHVVPRSIIKRYAAEARLRPHLAVIPEEFHATVPACFACNMRKGTRRLIPASWAHHLDALNALNIGTFRVWDGSVEALRLVVR